MYYVNFLLITKYYLGGQTKENEMGWRSEMRIEFWWGNLKVRNHLEDLGRGARIIIKRNIKIRLKVMKNWNGLAQNRDR